ncbi:MAG: enoyl-CoA hydratase [Alphaproteobacteria bacterium]|nr:enoyl-CoA hydratase [Alphaproteobacteria bacterium]
MSAPENSSEILRQTLTTEGILRLTLNDEKRRNALSEEMLNKLIVAFQDASSNDNVRVIIIDATGPVFSAGHDLKELTAARQNADGGKSYFTKIMDLCAKMMQSIVNCDKAVIAQVSGVATAAGCQLVASCDLAVAADGARFSTPGVNIGLFCSTPMVALSRNVSNKHAMEMLLTGDMVPAARAFEIGLINKAVPLEQLEDTTLELADKILSKSRHTITIGKTAFYAQREMTLSDAYDYAAQVMVENMLTLDAEEGICAFVEKRQPAWKDQ